MEKKRLDSPFVSVRVAEHVLWHFGDTNLGLEPGSFVSRLLLAVAAADSGNRERLALGFPDYVYAFSCVQGEPWGLEWLRSKVKRGLVPDRFGPDLFEAAAGVSL